MDEDDDEEEARIMTSEKFRERAFSECPRPRQKKQRSTSTMTLNRVQSDSNLSHIDKEKTFAFENRRKSGVLPSELLAKVVMALGGYRVGDFEDQQRMASNLSIPKGYHGFSDSQILAGEQSYNNSNWSINTTDKGYITPPHKLRLRAASEVRIPIESSVKVSNRVPHTAMSRVVTSVTYLVLVKPQLLILSFQASTEWTWSGANTQISEIEKMRSRAAKPKENLYKASLQTKLRYDSETAADDFPRDLPTKLNEIAAEAANKSLLSKLNPFKRKLPSEMKRHSLYPGQELDPQKYLRNTQYGRESVSSLSKNYLTQRRPSMFQLPRPDEEQDLLETTTIADLIRAIEMANTDEVVNDSPKDSFMEKKQRKLGTDHLTPSRYPSLVTLNAKQDSNLTIHGSSLHNNALKASGRNRLFSCVSTPTEIPDNSRGKILGDANPFVRHLSIRPPPPYTSTPLDAMKTTLKRRFSVRPSNLDMAPGQFHKPNTQIMAMSSQQTTSAAVTPFQRKLSWRPTLSSLVHSNETQQTQQSGGKKTDSTSTTRPS